jgi:PAS domain S-box-containing protein
VNLNIKEWLDIFARASESINDPVIIVDTSYEVLHANQKAIAEFYIDELSLTLDQIFTKESVNILTDEIGPSLFSPSKKNIKNIELTTNAGIKNFYNLIIDPIEIHDDKIILLVFGDAFSKKTEGDITLLSLNPAAKKEVDNNPSVKLIIDEIRKYIPITIVGLKQIQAFINSVDKPLWIKDNQLKILAVNKAFNDSFNIDENFAPGKKHETFLPEYLSKIFKTLDEYQAVSLSYTEIKFYVKKTNNQPVIQKYIQVPIKDNRNKLYIIIGLIYEENFEVESPDIKSDSISGFILNLPKAAALINFNNIIEQANREFCKFLGKEFNDIARKSFDDFFPYLISENIKSFINDENKSDEFFIDKDLNLVDLFSSFAKISLIKLSGKEKSDKFLMIIDDSGKIYQQENELQNILINRGKMFEVLIQNNPDPIFIYDKENLKFLEVNEAAVKFYGYSRDEFLQMDLTDLYAPEDIQTLLESFGEGTAEGKYSKPFRHRKKDGSSVIVEISKTSFRFKDKEAHFNIVKDITANIEKEKQNQMLKIIFNATDSLVFNTDASGFITYVNYPVIEKLGYTSNELLQSAFASLVSDEDRAFINTTIFQPNIKDEVTLSTKIKKHDGEFLEAEISASPLLDLNNEPESFTIVVKPASYIITKEVPKEIVKEVIKEVIVEKPVETKPIQQIQDANFFSGMFHEILTPMNVIIGFSQELLSGVDNPTEEQLEAAEIINQNRIKLMETMNAVVEYSEIAQNKFKLETDEVSITEIVDKLDKNIKDISGINEIQFSYGKISSSLKFRTDKQRFENLILLLIKVISRISKDKKVYFSAYPIDSDNFVIGVNDQYNNSSEQVSNIFDQIFNQGKDPKDFGLPKLSTYLAKILLDLLGGRYQQTIYGTSKNESGFIFSSNISLSEAAKKSLEGGKFTTEPVFIEPKAEENIIETTPSYEQESVSESEMTTESIEETSISTEDVQSAEVNPEEEPDIFKPVTTISEELLSKMEKEEEAKAEQENLENQQQENLVDTISVSNETYSQPLEEISQEIVNEIKETKAESEETFIPPIPSLNLADLSCLYIEDQVDSQILFKVQMKGLKDVKFAVSFEESQSLLLKYQFDFIVIDINLQGEYNGLDALKIIRTMPALSNVPIIAVTAYVLPGDKEKFIAAGFDDFISKPIFREKMMESLEKIFLSKY